MTRIFTLVVCAVFFGIACSEGTPVGEPCESPGQVEECVDGAVCTNESSSQGNTCRLICDDQADCSDGFQCSGITSTNLKSCKPSDK